MSFSGISDQSDPVATIWRIRTGPACKSLNALLSKGGYKKVYGERKGYELWFIASNAALTTETRPATIFRRSNQNDWRLPDMRTIGALIFPEFELLDLYGPLEMFTMYPDEFEIRIVAQYSPDVPSSGGPRTSRR